MGENHGMLQQTKSDIQKGSKSFFLASIFFSDREKAAAWKLYSWCRYCDDVVDDSAASAAQQIADPSTSRAITQKNVDLLKQQTQDCYQSKPSPAHPWPAFCEIIHEYHIPEKYPLDLVRGFQMDAEGAKIPDFETLLDYCYCVAGTVGLMMCHIMGVRSTQALGHAVALGQAMQLTNIARDIQEDFRRNRIYLPTTWLQEEGLNEQNLFEPQKRAHLEKVVRRLVDEAQSRYEFGIQGLKFLSLRSAWAVCIALHVYRDIGRQVLDKKSFDQRVVVSGRRKIFLLLKASMTLVPLAFTRMFRPWSPSQNIDVWSQQ